MVLRKDSGLPTMTGQELESALDRLALSKSKFATLIGVNRVTVQKWTSPSSNEVNTSPVPPFAAITVGWMLDAGRPKAWPSAPK